LADTDGLKAAPFKRSLNQMFLSR